MYINTPSHVNTYIRTCVCTYSVQTMKQFRQACEHKQAYIHSKSSQRNIIITECSKHRRRKKTKFHLHMPILNFYDISLCSPSKQISLNYIISCSRLEEYFIISIFLFLLFFLSPTGFTSRPHQTCLYSSISPSLSLHTDLFYIFFHSCHI